MATSTGTNAVLDPAGTGFGPRIIKQSIDGANTNSYVLGGTRFPGVAKYVTTTTAANDATQAAAILVALA